MLAGAALVASGQGLDSADSEAAVLDKILAGAPEGQSTIAFGDMFVKVEAVRAWRDQLRRKKGEGTGASEPGTGPDLAGLSLIGRWPAGVIPYAFDGSVSASRQKAFLDAAMEWSAFGNVQFIPRFGQADYVTVIDCACDQDGAFLGRQGGQQYILISSWNRETLVHEIGHTLGFIHEHQRSDRDAFVRVIAAHVTPGMEFNFTRLGTAHNQGAYDFDSVMHYPPNKLSISPTLNTLEPQPGYVSFLSIMGQQNGDRALSAGDRQGVSWLYGAPLAAPGAVVTNTKDSGPGSLRAAIYYASDHPGTVISFRIPSSDAGFVGGVFTIRLSDQLTRLGAGTTIDGTTQTGFTGDTNPFGPEIALDGSAVENVTHGLKITVGSCVVRGLAVSGFKGHGILVEGPFASGNRIEGCYIGTDPAGGSARGNGGNGIALLNGASGNWVGGNSGAARNIISGNLGSGVLVAGAGTTANSVSGNWIGLAAAGAATIRNLGAGISIQGGASGNFVGGTGEGSGNRIMGNGAGGVVVSGLATIGQSILGNSIYQNTGMGIDLGADGASANDSLDEDAGPNGLQNFPALNSAVLGTETVVRGVLQSRRNLLYRIEFFASPESDASGRGEGRLFLGSTLNVLTDGSGTGVFEARIPACLPAGQVISATATDPSGNTSEFSPAVIVTTSDADGDGLPDVYEVLHGLNPNVADSSLDLDGDGISGWSEFLAGTNPRDPNDFPQAPEVSESGGVIRVSFPTAAGRLYRLERGDEALESDWRPLVDWVIGTGGRITVTDAEAEGARRRFYRATVIP